jgi:hypothetical protein
MAAEQEQEEERRKRQEQQLALSRRRSPEVDWYPNQEKSQCSGWNAGNYFAGDRFWDTDEISKHRASKLHHVTS